MGAERLAVPQVGDPVRHTEPRHTADQRIDWILSGVVVENEDPLGIGRVRVRIPGILEPESSLAFPIGAMFGVKNGIHWVPEVGANVVVFCNQGDVDHLFYLAGPFGKPGGVSDVPEQAPGGSVDHVVIRWRDLHLTFNGTDGSERITVEDLVSGTKIEIDRPSGGDYLRDVEGDEIVRVKNDRLVDVELGDEIHNVTTGERTTSIQGDDTRTVIAGNDDETITAGNKNTTIPLGNVVETIAVGSKTVTAGLNVAITAGAAVNITAGGVMTLLANGMVAQSTAPSSAISSGLRTESFLGGVLSTITGANTQVVNGAETRTINGIFTLTVNGIANLIFNGLTTLLAAALNLGAGPVYKKIVNEDMIAAFNSHTHPHALGPGTTSPPTTTITPGGAAPYDRDDMVSVNVGVS